MKKIFLLTDYKSFDSEKDLYLFSNKAFFKNTNLENQRIKYQTMDSLNQNYQSRYDESKRVDKIIYNIEKDLYKSLNYYHSTNFSHRYWKIILGNWLARFIRIVYFRHKILHNWLSTDQKIDLIHLAKFDSYTQSIDQTNISWLASMDSEWNFNLLSKILIKSFNKKYDYNYIDTNKYQFTPTISKPINTKKEYIKNKLLKILSLLNFFSQNNTMAFKTTYLKLFDEIKLSLFNGEIPSILFNLNYKREKLDLIKRKNIDLKKKNDDPFENLIRDLIVDAIPKVAIEDYRNILSVINDSKWPLDPKIIFTSNSYDGDDFFKIWAAEKTEHKKSKYIIGQHGLFDCTEHLLKNASDYQVCDHYLRWGEKKYDKDIGLFNFKLIDKKIKLKNQNKIIVFARTTGHECETYSRIEEFKIYNDCLNKVLSNFDSNTLKKTIVRLKHTFKWTNPNEFNYLRKNFPLLKINEGIENVFSLLEKGKLAIFLYYSTGVVESLSLNIPTTFYCPKELVYIDPEERKYLDLLNKCKIVSYEEDEFKNNIEFILKDVKKWWSMKDVIQAKEEFLKRYSRIENDNPVLKISKLLKSLY